MSRRSIQSKSADDDATATRGKVTQPTTVTRGVHGAESRAEKMWTTQASMQMQTNWIKLKFIDRWFQGQGELS